ncbi:hypothetical protein J2R96_005829 [Bradyrhizobium elkanii]|nr:hypothetical protein [Bradyrhizobium elkanii]
MSNVIKIGKRLVPLHEIVLVEAYQPKPNSDIQSQRAFQARVVFLNRDSMLVEETQSAFAEAHGFRGLPDDPVALNGAIRFRIETFEPAEDFAPARPFTTRLRWLDADGGDQSKLTSGHIARASA